MTDELNRPYNLPEQRDDQHARTGAEQQDGRISQPIEIMLIDDDEFYADMLVAMLDDAGMRVQAFGTGQEALASLQRARPQLILLDYNMPGIDGIETLRQLKSKPDTKSIPVIMLTGTNSDDIAGQSIDAGAAGYIVKPGDRDKILSRIDEVLRNQGG